jgi:hypothetical protein
VHGILIDEAYCGTQEVERFLAFTNWILSFLKDLMVDVTTQNPCWLFN